MTIKVPKFINYFSKSVIGVVSSIFSVTIITKILASSFGPGTIGIFALLREYIKLFNQFFSLKSSEVLVQQLRENKNSINRNKIISSILSLILAISLISLLTILLVSPFFKDFILSILRLNSLFEFYTIILIGILGSTNIIFIAFLNANYNFFNISISESISYFSIMVLTFLFPYWFSDRQGILMLFLGLYSIWISINLYYVIKKKLFSNIKLNLSSINFSNSNTFLKLSIGSLFVVIAGIITNLIVKLTIIQKFDIDKLGIFESAWTIASVYMLVLFSSLSKFILPEFTNAGIREIKKIIKYYQDWSSALVTIIIIITIGFSDYIIELLYSSEFISSGRLLALLAFGDFFKLFSWIITIYFISKGGIKEFIFSSLFFNVLFISAVLGVNENNFLINFGFAYIIIHILYFILNVLILVINHKINFLSFKLNYFHLYLFFFLISIQLYIKFNFDNWSVYSAILLVLLPVLFIYNKLIFNEKI